MFQLKVPFLCTIIVYTNTAEFEFEYDKDTPLQNPIIDICLSRKDWGVNRETLMAEACTLAFLRMESDSD